MTVTDWKQSDIRAWATNNQMRCPNCGTEFATLNPLVKLYPHWTGKCVRPNPHPKENKDVAE